MTLDAIKDDNVKEKIMDLCANYYITVSIGYTENLKEQEDKIILSNRETVLDTITLLTQKNEKQLDELIDKTIKDVINTVKTNPNTFLISSAYPILEKYGFSKELKDLKKEEKHISISGTNAPSINKAAAIQYYSASGEEQLGGPLVGTTAVYKRTISWNVQDSKIIFYNPTYGITYNKTYYTYKGITVMNEGVVSPTKAYGYHYSRATFEKGVPWNKYDRIYLDIYFHRDGGFECYVDTD